MLPILLLSIVAAVLSAEPVERDAAPSPVVATPDEEDVVVRAAADLLRHQLASGGPVQFRGVFVMTTVGTDNRQQHSVCGELKAQSEHGTAAGWTKFYVAVPSLVIAQPGMSARLVEMVCARDRSKGTPAVFGTNDHARELQTLSPRAP